MSRWHTVPREDLIWRELDGELVVRNARSGSTHLLEPLAAEVLLALIESGTGMSAQELATRLCNDNDSKGEWLVSVKAVLDQFQRLGLAERNSD